MGPAPGSAPAPAPNVPFPAGVKYRYVNLEQGFAGSAEGQRIQTLIQSKQNELQAKQKAFQDAQQKAQSQASVMSDAAKAQAQADLERQDKDLQRLLEDAQTEVQGAQQQAQAEWQRRIQPVVQKLSQEKGLHFLLSVPDSGLVWADPQSISRKSCWKCRRARRASGRDRRTGGSPRGPSRDDASAAPGDTRHREVSDGVSDLPALLDRVDQGIRHSWSTRSRSTSRVRGSSPSRTSHSTKSSSRDIFPARPSCPACCMIEALTQVAAVLILEHARATTNARSRCAASTTPSSAVRSCPAID